MNNFILFPVVCVDEVLILSTWGGVRFGSVNQIGRACTKKKKLSTDPALAGDCRHNKKTNRPVLILVPSARGGVPVGSHIILSVWAVSCQK